MELLIDFTMHLVCWKANHWIRVRLATLFRYGIGPAKTASLEDIQVLHSSQNFLVVNKRYDVLINCDNPNVQVTVENQLKKKYPDLVNPKLFHSFHFAHRLDYPTSGVLCIALHKEVAMMASEAFSKRKTRKYYLAFLRGHVSQELVDIKYSIGFDTRPENMGHKMAISEKPYCHQPKSAFTRLLVLELGLYNNYPATKVLLKPITGRRHQLRVHCSSLGHTIVGDFTYSNQKDILPYRMFLHAQRLIVPTKIESIDVCTKDPFTQEDPKNKWTILKTVNAFDPSRQHVYQKIDTQVASLTVGT